MTGKTDYTEIYANAIYNNAGPLTCNFPIKYFDYIKIGPYIPKLGGLDNVNTNQIMYKIEDGRLIDITSKFWK